MDNFCEHMIQVFHAAQSNTNIGDGEWRMYDW